MFIVAQNRKSIVNVNIALKISVSDTCIIVAFNGGIAVLGNYKTEERAMKVFEYVASSIALGQNIINMPEE